MGDIIEGDVVKTDDDEVDESVASARDLHEGVVKIASLAGTGDADSMKYLVEIAPTLAMRILEHTVALTNLADKYNELSGELIRVMQVVTEQGVSLANVDALAEKLDDTLAGTVYDWIPKAIADAASGKEADSDSG